jgi:hypothetical protein
MTSSLAVFNSYSNHFLSLSNTLTHNTKKRGTFTLVPGGKVLVPISATTENRSTNVTSKSSKRCHIMSLLVKFATQISNKRGLKIFRSLLPKVINVQHTAYIYNGRNNFFFVLQSKYWLRLTMR